MGAFNYNIFGLNIQSLIEIPGLKSTSAGVCDVNIKYGATPNHLANIISSSVLFESTNEEFLLKIPNIGNYYVKRGLLIVVDPQPGATQDELRLFLLGSVFGALLYQRKFIPLHGSSVEVKGKAFIIIGNSAAGKSTLAASLVKSGYPLISDDLSALTLKSGICKIMPGVPFVKLWKDSKDQLFPGNSFKRVRPQINKFNIPLGPQCYNSEGYAIETIISLNTRNHSDFFFERKHGASKIKILREHVFRDQLISGMGMMNYHFEMLSALANQANIFHIERPSSPLDINSLKSFILDNVI